MFRRPSPVPLHQSIGKTGRRGGLKGDLARELPGLHDPVGQGRVQKIADDFSRRKLMGVRMTCIAVGRLCPGARKTVKVNRLSPPNALCDLLLPDENGDRSSHRRVTV